MRVCLLVITCLAGPLLHLGAKPQIFHAGHERDVAPLVEPGLLLMGGGGDVDPAMRWFLEKAGGGDIVVLRASGGDGYNAYLLETLGVPVNSVRSVVFRERGDAMDPEVHALLERAEGIFLAGGDQSRYIRFWKDTPIQALLNAHVAAGKPLGGTSAGLAVLGEFAYSAMHEEDLTSAQTLADPAHPLITLEKRFLEIPLLKGVLTDSHFTERSRLGRLFVMAARLADQGESPLGIGIDERTALCVEGSGKARVLSAAGGRVSLLQAGPRSPQSREGGPFGPRVADVRVLGPESVFHLRSREVDGEEATVTLLAMAGELRAVRETDPAGGPLAGLLIVGGGLRESNTPVHEALIQRGRLRNGGRLGIIPAASGRPVENATRFESALLRHGAPAESIHLFPLAVADDPTTPDLNEEGWASNAWEETVAAGVASCTAIWFTGGDQDRIMRLMRDGDGRESPLFRGLKAALMQGAVVGGTSAGAAVQSDLMILGGSSPGALRHGLATDYASMKEQEDGPLILGRGLGLFPHGLIDQHFDRKARLGRLVVALMARKGEVTHGYGVDENTALEVDLASRTALVRGTGTVVVVDASAAIEEDGAIQGVRISVLGDGDRIVWPGPQVIVNPRKSLTTGREYMDLVAPRARGLMDPYGGRLEDALGYLLADNRSAAEIESGVHYPDGSFRRILFRADKATRGYWGTLDGQLDSYTTLGAILEIGPLQSTPVHSVQAGEAD